MTNSGCMFGMGAAGQQDGDSSQSVCLQCKRLISMCASVCVIALAAAAKKAGVFPGQRPSLVLCVCVGGVPTFPHVSSADPVQEAHTDGYVRVCERERPCLFQRPHGSAPLIQE